MMLGRISTVRFIARRFLELGGWRLVSVFLRDFRQRGLIPTLRKAWRRLFWDQGANYLHRTQQWYEQHSCAAASIHAPKLFTRPNVLIVGSLDLAQCKKYRVLQKVELLEKLGFSCQVSEYRDVPRVINTMQLATLVLFYRVPDGELFRLYVKEAERLKVRIGYDIDDPILAPDVYAENKNLETLDLKEKKQLLASAALYRSAIQLCEFLSVSTPGMLRLVSTFYDGPIFVWRNVLDSETLSIVTEYQRARDHAITDGNITVGYMSGSRAHDADFATIETALGRVLVDHPEVELMIGGYATVSNVLQSYGHRIQRVPFTGYTGYFATLSKVSINVVPLLHDRFNECKSAIRFLEAAALGIATIASEVGDFCSLINPGDNGMLVKTPDQWEQALRQLVESVAMRDRLGENSRQYVLREQTVEALARNMRNELSVMLQAAV